MNNNQKFNTSKKIFSGNPNVFFKFILYAFSVLLIFPVKGFAQSPEIDWIEGPATVDLGNDLAQVEMSEAYAFADAEDTKIIMEAMGNPSNGTEVGLIIPKDRNADWFIVFEYAAIGYVRDDEKDSLDADAILESIRSGTEEANKIRKERGFTELNVIGWYDKPHYDEKSHNLVWAVLAEDGEEKEQIVNYNIRLLGRTGYASVVLVANPATLDSIKPELESIVKGFSYKTGKSYAEFVEGDEVAKYGLTALVAGGVGAAAAKAGVFKSLAKFGKYIILAVLAFFGALWKKVKGVFGENRNTTISE